MPNVYFDVPNVDLAAKRANLYSLEAQKEQNALDEQARQIKARNLYGDASAGGATPSDMTQMYRDQGIPMEGQQMMNTAGELQRNSPDRKAMQSPIMWLTTLPDDKIMDAYKQLKAYDQQQGADVSHMPDETKITDPSSLRTALMLKLDPQWGEKAMQYKEITEQRKMQSEQIAEARRYAAEQRAQSLRDVATIGAKSREKVAETPKRAPATPDIEQQKLDYRKKLLANAYYARLQQRNPAKFESIVNAAFAGGEAPAAYDPLNDPNLVGQ